ncbi:MAG: hypothetical protein ACRD1X_00395 [Vicinamibacteria bacterium]
MLSRSTKVASGLVCLIVSFLLAISLVVSTSMLVKELALAGFLLLLIAGLCLLFMASEDPGDIPRRF